MFVVLPETLNVKLATTPLEIPVLFNPQMIHTELPATLLHETDLPAAVATGPAAIVSEVKSVVEYWTVHWTAAGSVPLALLERFNVTAEPGKADPGARVKFTFCANPPQERVSALPSARNNQVSVDLSSIIK